MEKDVITNWEKNQKFDPSEIYSQLKDSYASKYDNLESGEIDDYLDRIAYHESKGIHDAVQKSNIYDEDRNVTGTEDGPGRGLFQFEIGEGAGAQTAIQRFRNYYGDTKSEHYNQALAEMDIPDDFSKLPPDMQKAIFMTNMMAEPNRESGTSWVGGTAEGGAAAGMLAPGGIQIGSQPKHVKANLSDVKKRGDQGLEDFWVNYHWKGSKADPDSIQTRRASFKRDQDDYNEEAY